MAETLVAVASKAVFWGLGASLTATGTGMGTFLPQGADFDTESEVVEVPDYKGETVAAVFFNPVDMFKLEVVPTGTTIALAKAAAVLPAPGAIITVVDTDDTEVAGATTAAYVFMRGTKRRSNKGVVTLNFELKRWTANGVSTVISS
jgi:hypothetical protein